MEVIQLIRSRGRTETQVYLIAKPVPDLHTTRKEKKADARSQSQCPISTPRVKRKLMPKRGKYLHLEGSQQRRNSLRITESQGSTVSSQPRKEKEKGMGG